ncbi:MAG: LemA family protein [Flavobacteriales bacterium]|nr:LemA family protein [Flavobacteriales bacterium]|tara:strand:- start:486 stop:1073 length:588 start_codon:yes stop_codon:yes gene_type:complete
MEKIKKHIWKIILIGFPVLYFIFWFNGTVSAEEDVEGQWSKVESTYQRRMDLLPNLMRTVQSYAAQEKEVLLGVTQARASVGKVTIDANNLKPENIQAYQQAQSGLTQALSKLMVIQERYPDLKSNQNFMALQDELAGTENRINVARDRFSDSAKKFNKKIKKIPGRLFNSLAGFEEKGYFKSDKGAEKAPELFK